MENETLATELLHELKMSARRWFISFCIMVGLEIGTIAGFVWYMSLPVEESTESIDQDTDGGGNNAVIGGDYNGTSEDSANHEKESGKD